MTLRTRIRMWRQRRAFARVLRSAGFKPKREYLNLLLDDRKKP